MELRTYYNGSDKARTEVVTLREIDTEGIYVNIVSISVDSHMVAAEVGLSDLDSLLLGHF